MGFIFGIWALMSIAILYATIKEVHDEQEYLGLLLLSPLIIPFVFLSVALISMVISEL